MPTKATVLMTLGLAGFWEWGFRATWLTRIPMSSR